MTILQYIYLYGTPITKKLIKKTLDSNLLSEMKNNYPKTEFYIL